MRVSNYLQKLREKTKKLIKHNVNTLENVSWYYDSKSKSPGVICLSLHGSFWAQKHMEITLPIYLTNKMLFGALLETYWAKLKCHENYCKVREYLRAIDFWSKASKEEEAREKINFWWPQYFFIFNFIYPQMTKIAKNRFFFSLLPF